MKKIILLATVFICCLQFCISFTQAQTLYGNTYKGGDEGGGTINKFTPAANSLLVVKSFQTPEGVSPKGSLIQASDGKLYGMTTDGGSYGVGIIFSLDPSSSIYTKLHDFDNANGANPVGSLMQASDGKLYGMTSGGGSDFFGVIFSFDPSSSTYTKLKDFDNTNGGSPSGSLMQASDGKLYGMTTFGGGGFAGVIFSYDPSSSTYTNLKDFGGIDGRFPSGSLIQASNGKLYGITNQGGSNGYGVIFSFNPVSFTYTKLIDFTGTNGVYERGSLMQASDGKLYGMNPSIGAGVIFSFDPLTSTYTNLKEFDNTNGGNPQGSLIQAKDGKLYGMTYDGGSSNLGVIFSFDPSSSTYTNLKEFNKTIGGKPQGSLIQANDGKLYGMTHDGGSSNLGVIFSFDPSSLTHTKLKNFGTNETGTNAGGLTQANDGRLYGMTNKGGSGGNGVIFFIDPASSTYTKLRDFDDSSGAHPYGNLLQASDGKLYGMTTDGGSSDFGDLGVIFSLDPSSSSYTNLKDFDYTNGANPGGNLIQASDGKLYGMAFSGGSGGYGVIFSFDPSSSTFTKLKDFDYTNGAHPYGSLLQASDGKLYGMTHDGGSSDLGVIFFFDPSSSTFTKLKDFDYTTGAYPFGSLMQASDGKLYGMTSEGGSMGRGIIFSFDPSTFTFTNLKDFDGANGSNPYGSLMQASDGMLYGMTYGGGSSGAGVIFSFDPASSTYTKLKDYNGANGANPYAGSAFIEVKEDIDENKPPIVSITSPANNTSYVALAHIPLIADAKDLDGTIKKVQFFNGTTLLATQNFFPYTYTWHNVPAGEYNFTAQATDNKGAITTSEVVHVTVLPNKAPSVSITSPVNNAIYKASAAIRLVADAKDEDGIIKKVQFYNGTTLIATQNYFPYALTWYPIPAGNYEITAKAIDDKGGVTTSEIVYVSVAASNNINVIAGSTNVNNGSAKIFSTGSLSLKAGPVPAKNILNIYTTGLIQNKKLVISVVSVSGIVMKTVQTTSNTTMQMDVSSLRPGVYFLKVLSGDNTLYTQFVKL